ncbi:unnamed protein product [Mycena citricolor]|uniref:F-box domain-containing protein n=1 Tax=Mycena citricolor TaxID=2018698 RepID=A0AAD2HZD5_9AGAR|nr:unnamed protein product [Mycena citricolor]
MAQDIREEWIIIYHHRLFRPTSTMRKQDHPPARQTPSLPPEIWMQIHRASVERLSPVNAIDEGEKSMLNENGLRAFLRTARTLRRVSRAWNQLARPLLFAHIRVPDRGWQSLSDALEDPETARLVRTARLSTTRFDLNESVLCRCAHLRVVSLGEFPRLERVGTAGGRALSTMAQLTHVEWVVSDWSGPLLLALLAAAPNVTHLVLKSSSTIGRGLSAPKCLDPFPALRSLHLLSAIDLNEADIHAILRASDAFRPCLTHLAIRPKCLSDIRFPVLPALRTLDLGDSAVEWFTFNDVFERCPNVHTVGYHALCASMASGANTPRGAASALVCLRIRLDALRMSPLGLALIERCLQTLFDGGPLFASLERIVCEGGGWRSVRDEIDVADWLMTELEGRGCRIEYA